MWQRKFPFKVLIAIFLDLQPLWPSSQTKPDLLRFRCFSGHVLSKTKSVTPNFFYISDITKSLSFNGKIFRKKINVRKFWRERPLRQLSYQANHLCLYIFFYSSNTYMIFHIFTCVIIYGYITSQYDQLTVGLKAQLVIHYTGITEIMGSNTEFHNCL